MKKIIINIICLILFSNLTSIIAVAQTISNLDFEKKIEENYQKLHSSDFMKRYDALHFFSNLKKEKLPEKVFKTVADLLKTEIEGIKKVNEFFAKGGVAENLPKDIDYINSEAYGMYSGYLCEIAGKSRNKSLLPLLVEYCMEPKVLINFGDAAVEPVIDKLLKTDNPMRKTNAIRVLAEMLKPKKEGYVAKGEARNRIKEVLIQATSDKDRHVRSVAVRALGDSGDKDVIPVLEEIAKSDPFSVEKKDPFTGKTITDPATGKTITLYPMREEAQKAIQRIKEQKKPEGK